jgi:hypothetical protein
MRMDPRLCTHGYASSMTPLSVSSLSIFSQNEICDSLEPTFLYDFPRNFQSEVRTSALSARWESTLRDSWEAAAVHYKPT